MRRLSRWCDAALSFAVVGLGFYAVRETKSSIALGPVAWMLGIIYGRLPKRPKGGWRITLGGGEDDE